MVMGPDGALKSRITVLAKTSGRLLHCTVAISRLMRSNALVNAVSLLADSRSSRICI
jgi:hypothetical protein